MSVSASPFEGTQGRMIHLHVLAGTLTFSLDHAIEVVQTLTSAIERAIDPTPLAPPPRLQFPTERGTIASQAQDVAMAPRLSTINLLDDL